MMRTAEVVGNLLAHESIASSQGPQHVSATRERGQSESEFFEQLYLATLAIAIVSALSRGTRELGASDGRSLTELQRTLEIRSRRRAYDAVSMLVVEGWLERANSAGTIRYRPTKEGVRQLQRLSAVSDGPCAVVWL